MIQDLEQIQDFVCFKNKIFLYSKQTTYNKTNFVYSSFDIELHENLLAFSAALLYLHITSFHIFPTFKLFCSYPPSLQCVFEFKGLKNLPFTKVISFTGHVGTTTTTPTITTTIVMHMTCEFMQKKKRMKKPYKMIITIGKKEQNTKMKKVF